MKTTDKDCPALFDPQCYDHPVGEVELVETHISWVFLAGDYAYKVKKPIRLPFLDFSTIAARRAFCEEELRLNRRTAPDLYLQVLPITGTPTEPRVGGEGDAFEYALQMRRFDQAALADALVCHGALGDAQIDALAAVIAAFHAALPAATPDSLFGTQQRIAEQALENFEELERFVISPAQVASVGRLRAWTLGEGTRLGGIFESRKRDGFVRECHGDLHLQNIVFLEDRPVPFDCIEFNAALRWIDVVSEVAFLAMDLEEHGLDDQAWRFLNAYIETTGDYHGLVVLNYYRVYRALVRAKIALIRAHQSGIDEPSRQAFEQEFGRYIRIAERFALPGRPVIMLMHGLAGSGKTTVAQAFIKQGGAVRVRSDVERKRLHGLPAMARTHAGQHTGIYAAHTTRRTYDRLKAMVREIVRSGFCAIVDASFLLRSSRDEFFELARQLQVPVRIVGCHASHDELRRRVVRREADGKDASEAGLAVLENQIRTQEPLAADELECLESIDTGMEEGKLAANTRSIAMRLFGSEGPGSESIVK